METGFQYGMIIIAGWIASTWPGEWTPLLFILSLSAMCFAKAVETHLMKARENKPQTSDKDLRLVP